MHRPTQPAPLPDPLPRGVWQANYYGPNGEMVLLAIDRHHCRQRERVVPHGGSRIAAANELLDELNAMDPIPNIRIV